MTLEVAPIENSLDEIEATLVRSVSEPEVSEQECCLVQIYPADIVDGMVLLDDQTFVIGRDPKNDLCLPHSSVSREHVELKPQGSGRYQICDLQSTNGTQLNDQSIESTELKNGDTVQIGHYLFKFLAAGSIETQYHETVYSALTTDALTGALNKRYMLETLQRELARSKRQDAELAVVMLDIDHFKSVNDTHGHLVGDEVLREFATRCQAICREDDLFARYGGEEFCLCIFGGDRASVQAITSRCLRAIAERPFSTSAGELTVTASFGVALRTAYSECDTLGLIGAADNRLYAAKEAGRNQVCF